MTTIEVDAVSGHLPPALAQFMRRFHARRNLQRLLARSGLALLAFIGFALLSCMIDRLAQLPAAARLALLLVDIGAGLIILWPSLQPLLRLQMDWNHLASDLEQRNPTLRQRLLTVISQFAGPTQYRASGAMLTHLAEAISHDVAATDAHDLAPLNAAVRPWLWCAVAIAL